jgi:hypothetical protein
MNSDPLELIGRLERDFVDFGAVKLTVSDVWNCPFTFGNTERPMTLRKQVLQSLTKGKVLGFLFLSFWKVFFFSLFSFSPSSRVLKRYAYLSTVTLRIIFHATTSSRLSPREKMLAAEWSISTGIW